MRSYLLIVCLLFVGVCNSQTTGTMKDSRDGKVYKTVVIGAQTWMAENLNVDKFRNGDPIPEAKTNEEWLRACEAGKPVWCYYDNDSVNGRIYGRHYNYYVVNDPRGLAPEGWHIPSLIEWSNLKKVFGDNAGKKMKSTNFWKNLSEGTYNGIDSLGFSGLPGGFRSTEGDDLDIGFYEGYWTSQESGFIQFDDELNEKPNLINKDSTWAPQVYFDISANFSISLYYNNRISIQKWDLFSGRSIGISVRCIKD